MTPHSNSRQSRRRTATLPTQSVFSPALNPCRWRCEGNRLALRAVRASRLTSHESRITSHASQLPRLATPLLIGSYEPSHRSPFTNLVANHAISNRHLMQLETAVTRRKQTTAPISNRHKFSSYGSPLPARELPTLKYPSLRSQPRITDHCSPIANHSVCACGEPLRN